MRLLTLHFFAALIFITMACKDKTTTITVGDDTDLPPVETITGNLAVSQQWQGENIVIAFMPDYFIYHESDTINAFDEDPPYTIIKKTTLTSVSGTEQYAIDIPTDKDATRYLIAWVDMNKDGELNMTNDESVRFPRKKYEEENVVVVVTRWVYGINGRDNSFSLVLDKDGQHLTSDFLIDMRGNGFNFGF